MLKDADLARKEKLSQVSQKLLEYFGVPDWHEMLPPVDELVCTILSQNTNDINRDKAFMALKERYSSWEEVRDADSGELQYVIRIAGLAQQKGPNIQAALREISEKNGAIDLEWLKTERRKSPGLVGQSQRCWSQNSGYRDGFYPGHAGLSGRYSCLPREWKDWTAS